ncbi:MAG: hypothetical protein ACQESP_01175 [Candidatus Muiribacteriota bacterium]
MNKKDLIIIFVSMLVLTTVFAEEMLIISGDARAMPGNLGQKGGVVSFAEYISGLEKDYYYIDCGNVIDVNRYTMENHGRAVYKIFEIAGLEILSPSNHEFNYGIESFKENTKAFNVVSTNSNIGKDYHILEINGVRILFLGHLREDIHQVLSREIADNIELENSKNKIKKILQDKKGQYDKIIALSSADESETINTFSSFEAIDHVFYISGKSFSGLHYIKGQSGSKTMFYAIPAGYELVWEGVLKNNKLEFNYKKLKKPSKEEFTRVLKNLPSKRDTQIKDKDLFIKSLMSYIRKETESDVSLLNTGTFRYDMDGFQDFLRFDNVMHKVRITGRDLKNMHFRDDLILYGLESDGKKIFNRDIIDSYNYSVLVNDFLYRQRDNLNLNMIMKKENVIGSIKNFASENIDKLDKEYHFFKKYISKVNEFSIDISDISGRGANADYSSVSKIPSSDTKLSRIIFKNNYFRDSRTKTLSNTINYRRDRNDNETNFHNIRMDTNLRNKENGLSIVQRVDMSLIKNNDGDRPVNYRLSLGNELNDYLYAGLSYQQVFPRRGRDHYIGIQLTGSESKIRSNGLNTEHIMDIFYSNTNDEYYEGELKNNFRFRLRQSLFVDLNLSNFLVYDESIEKRAYSSEIFFGLSTSFSSAGFYK